MPNRKKAAPLMERYEVPREVTEVIDRRTLSLLGTLPEADYDLRTLLRSAYMQGLLDALTLAERGKFPGCGGETPNRGFW